MKSDSVSARQFAQSHIKDTKRTLLSILATQCQKITKKKIRRKFLRLRLVFLIVLLFDVVPELLASRRVTELAQSLRLDLADTLTGDVELLADLLKGVGMAVGESEAH